MRVIVSDTSPVRALAHLGSVELLERLFGHVLVPPAVADELRLPRGPGPSVDIADYPFLEVRAPGDAARVAALGALVDPGESEAIALAEELGADLLLVDDRRARDAATRAGLATTGLVGVLLQAKRDGLVPDVLPLIDRLRREASFFLSARVRAAVAALADEPE